MHPGHARTFAARRQAANPTGNVVLLSVRPHAGHGGADRVADDVRSWTLELSFLMTQFDMQPKAYPTP